MFGQGGATSASDISTQQVPSRHAVAAARKKRLAEEKAAREAQAAAMTEDEPEPAGQTTPSAAAAAGGAGAAPTPLAAAPEHGATAGGDAGAESQPKARLSGLQRAQVQIFFRQARLAQVRAWWLSTFRCRCARSCPWAYEVSEIGATQPAPLHNPQKP